MTHPTKVAFGQPVYLIAANAEGTEKKIVSVDEVNGALVTADAVHHEVHEGEMFHAFIYDNALADDDTINILLQTGGGKQAHVTYFVSGGGDAEVRVTEGVAINDAGDAFTPINRNRISDNGSETQVSTNATVVGGDRIDNFALGGGTGGNAAGGATRREVEWMLKQNNAYLFECYNRSGGAKLFSLNIDYYEEGRF